MSIRERVKNYMSKRRAMRALYALDDHALKDVGLHRSQIHSAVAGR